MADGTRRMRKTWRVIRTGKRREERVDLRKRKISTSFSPARNHLECSRATCSRRIKVLFWEEREGESERKREWEQFERWRLFREIFRWTGIEETFSIRLPCLSTTGRYNEIRLPLPWQASLKGTASEVTRDGARWWNTRCIVPRYSQFSLLFDMIERLAFENVYTFDIISKKFCRYFGYRGWLVKFSISSQYTYI